MVSPAPGAAERDDKGRDVRFRAIFECEFDYVWSSLRRLGVHTRDIEDVAQELFVHVYRRFDEYDPSRPIRPWLFAFAYRCASDWRRLARHRIEAQLDVEHRPSETPGPDHAIDAGRDRALVLQSLEGIDLERRAVFVLYELDETPIKTIAETLGIPLFTAYSRLRVARQEFAAAAQRLRAKEVRHERA